MKYIKQQVELFLTALGFFSRIPIPYKLAFSQDNLNRCNRYFPLVGLVIGGIGAGIYLTAALILPQSVSILLSMAATILATGAFHEDGFADVCDGFGRITSYNVCYTKLLRNLIFLGGILCLIRK